MLPPDASRIIEMDTRKGPLLQLYGLQISGSMDFQNQKMKEKPLICSICRAQYYFRHLLFAALKRTNFLMMHPVSSNNRDLNPTSLFMIILSIHPTG